MKVLFLFLSLTQITFAQTEGIEKIPSSLVIMGRGIENEEGGQTLLMACVGKSAIDNMPNCDSVRMVIYQKGMVPQWAGYSFSAQDLERVRVKLQKWYSETSSNGFLGFLKSSDVFALTEKNGWNWANHPLDVDSTAFTRITTTITAYSYVQNASENQQAISHQNVYSQSGSVLAPLAPVQASGNIAIVSGEPCDVEVQAAFEKEEEPFKKHPEILSAIQKIFDETNVIAEQVKANVQDSLTQALNKKIKIDDQLISVRSAQEFLTYRKSVLDATKLSSEEYAQKQRFENPKNTNLGITGSSTRLGVKNFYDDEARELSKKLKAILKDEEGNLYGRSSGITFKFKDDTEMVNINDIEVCMQWDKIFGKDTEILNVLGTTNDFYCYSLMNPKKSFNLWVGIDQQQASFRTPEGKFFPFGGWTRYYKVWESKSRAKSACSPMSGMYKLRYSARDTFTSEVDRNESLQRVFVGPTVSYAQFDDIFSKLWDEFRENHSEPSLPEHIDTQRGADIAGDIQNGEGKYYKYLRKFNEFILTKYPRAL